MPKTYLHLTARRLKFLHPATTKTDLKAYAVGEVGPEVIRKAPLDFISCALRPSPQKSLLGREIEQVNGRAQFRKQG